MPTDNTDSVSMDFFFSDNTDSISGPSSTKIHQLTWTKSLGLATACGRQVVLWLHQIQCTNHVTSAVLAHWGWWPRLAETTAGDGMLMLQAAELVHVTASVRIVCVKMSNKHKQTALDLDQKIAIINEIEGAKTASSCGGLRCVETNSKLDMSVTALLPHCVIMMMMAGVVLPVCIVNVL